MPSITLIISEMLLWIYVLIVYQIVMSEQCGLFLPGIFSAPDYRILSNIIILSLAGAGGMAYFAYYYRRLASSIQKNSPLYALAGAAIGQLLMEFFPTSPAPMTIGLLLSMFGWGYLMAYVLFKVVTESPGTHFGRFIGVSLGLGAIVIYIIGIIDSAFSDMIASRILALPILIVLAIIIKSTAIHTESLNTYSSDWDSLFQKSRTYLIVAACFMGLLMGLCDSVTVVRFSEYAPAFPASRLFYAVGLFLFGWLADKKFSAMPAVVLVISTYFLWYRTFNTEPGLFLLLAQMVEAIYAAPIIVMMMTGFLHIAAHSDKPEKWAAMSRIIELPSMSLGLILGVLFFPYFSLSVTFAIYATLLLISVALVYKITILYMQGLADATAEKQIQNAIEEYKQNYKREYQQEYEHKPQHYTRPDEAVKFDTYCNHYNLTEREANVLQELLKGLKISTIADNLFISERTVRFHITNILNKTGQDSQLSIVSDYYRSGLPQQ